MNEWVKIQDFEMASDGWESLFRSDSSSASSNEWMNLDDDVTLKKSSADNKRRKSKDFGRANTKTEWGEEEELKDVDIN